MLSEVSDLDDKATLLEQAINRRTVLYRRIKEAKRAAESTTDPTDRRHQLERARILRDMYRDACDEVFRLEGKRRTERKTVVHGDFIFGSSEVWSDLTGMTWNALDGAAWGDILAAREPGAATGRQSQLLVDLLNDSIQSCTDRQKALIHQYYTQGNNMDEIGEAQGVNRSTVSRVIKRGLAHVAHHVVARLTIASCIDGRGRFDYLKFCRSASILTERQTELLYLALTQDASYTMMSAYIGRQVSTVCRTVDRLEARLAAVRVELLPEIDVSGIRFKDWAGLDETTLAAKLGLSRKFFYSVIRRGETVCGLPLMHYHILCRMRGEGWPVERTAQELSCGRELCKKVLRSYEGVTVPLELARLPGYTPIPARREPGPGTVLASLRDLTRGENQIIDRIDGPTLERLKAVARC